MGLIPDEAIRQVLDRSEIVQTIMGYIPLKRAGRNFKALCPFHHEKSPSFVVNPDKQIFHCFGCGVGGNVISFIMRQEHMDFPEAVEWLANKFGITIIRADDKQAKAKAGLKQQLLDVNELAANFYHEHLLAGQTSSARQAREYLKGRGINLPTVKRFKIGCAPEGWDNLLEFLKKKEISLNLIEKAGLILSQETKQGFYDRFRNRIMFPIFDSRGQCVAFGARTLEKDATGAKYINSPETPLYTKGQHLYGFHAAKEAVGRQDFALVVEGYMDFLTPFQAGIEPILASLGTALTTDQIRLILRYTENVVMLFDSDPAGEAAMIRSLDLLIEEGMNVKVVSLNRGEDPDSFINKFGVQALRERIQKAHTLFDYKINWLKGKFDMTTVEGKSAIAREMFPTLNKFTNEITRFGYLQRLAEILSVPKETLLTEMAKQAPGSVRFKEVIITQKQTSGSMRAAEEHLLKLMLDKTEFISLTRQSLDPEDFQDEKIRLVINRIFSDFESGKSIDVQGLISSFPEDGIRQMLSGLLTPEDSFNADKTKIHRDCLNRIKEEKIKFARLDLIAKIRVAEGTDDQQQLEILKAQFNQLIKRQ